MRPLRTRVTVGLALLIVAGLAASLLRGGPTKPRPLSRADNQRRAEYRETADYHAEKERESRQQLDEAETILSRGIPYDPLIPAIGNLARARADYHARMRLKYLRASEQPWVPVPPDPPEPTDKRVVISGLPEGRYIEDDLPLFPPIRLPAPPAPLEPADKRPALHGFPEGPPPIKDDVPLLPPPPPQVPPDGAARPKAPAPGASVGARSR